MKRARFGLREKILATHLLVAASSTVSLLAVLLLLFTLFTPSLSNGIQVVPALVVLGAVALAGVAAAFIAAGWLYRQLAVSLRRASSLARVLAKGEYTGIQPGDARLAPSQGDELNELATTLDDLSISLREAERRRTDAFDEITHELRTPIAILEGYMEGLLDGHVKPTEKTWAMLYDVASRVHRLVDTLRVLSRAETRRDPPDLQSVAPDAIARAALDRMRLHFDE